MTIPKIISVIPLENLKIKVTFENNVIKTLDVSPYLNEFPIFRQLKNPELFKQVHIDCNGLAIAWNEDIDLSRYDIYEFGT